MSVPRGTEHAVRDVWAALKHRADKWPIVNGPTPVLDRAPWNAPEGAERSWFKLRNLGGNAADLWIYSEIGMWGVTAEGLVSELATLNVADITVHLNSPGGDVFDGIAIMNALRDHPAKVTVNVDALAASIASVIAQAGDHVVMGNNAMMMIHNASGYAAGEAVDLRKMADLLDQTTANIASIYAQRAGGSAKDWLDVMAEEKWYDAADAVKAGLADEVAPLPAERGAHQQAARFDLSVYNHAPAELPKVKDLIVPHPDGTVDPLIIPITEDWDVSDQPIAASFADMMRSAVATAVDDVTPKPIVWDSSLFRGAMSLVIDDAPAPTPTTVPEPPKVPGFMDPSTFAQAIREARSA